MINKPRPTKQLTVKKQEITEAYHGTDYDSAREIIKNRTFIPSKGKNCYLGDGVYFFENSRWHAEDWIRHKISHSGKFIFGIIQARISLGRCLDLNDGRHRKLVMDTVKELRKSVPQINDAVVINFLTQLGGIDTVRATYCQPREGTLFEGSKFFIHSSLMNCVKNSAMIRDISLIYSEQVQQNDR